MKDIIETIRRRQSVRTFSGAPLTESQKSELNEAIASASNPFGAEPDMRLIDVDLDGPFRPGTYGVIRGARSYLVMGIAEDDMAKVAAGYAMEQVVLQATEMGLGTCWIAATFNGTDFARLAKMPLATPLRIVCPVGEPAQKKSLLERMTRTIARSSSRKPFGDLFFSGDFKTSLQPDTRFGEPLEMLRLAPSSTNSQPWRAVVCGDTVHFYCRPGKCALLDLGIGLCHFDLTCRHLNMSGHWRQCSEHPESDSLSYVTSFILS